MRPIKVAQLEPGSVLREGLYSTQGHRLLAAGRTITDRILHLLHLGGHQHVLLGRTAADVRSESSPAAAKPTAAAPVVVVPPRRHAPPRPSAFAPRPVSTRRDAADHDRRRLTPSARATLKRSADRIVATRRAKWGRLPLRVQTGIDPLPLSSLLPADFSPRPDLDRFFTERGEVLARVFSRLAEGRHADAWALYDLADELIDLASRRAPTYPQIALMPRREGDSLAEHAYTCAAITVGLCARLGWSAADTRDAGVAALLADSGMLLLPEGLRSAQRPLDDGELNAVRHHPAYSVAMAELVRGLPDAVALAIYQHHERLDGSGYPSAVNADRIHDTAKVLAVADSFAAAIAPRAYKPRALPFEAVQSAIKAVSSTTHAPRFDIAVVRALVELCGLFPVGSHVKLSTGHIASVLAYPVPSRPDRPLVRIRSRRSIMGVIASSLPHLSHPLSAHREPTVHAVPGECLDLSVYTPSQVRVLQAVAVED